MRLALAQHGLELAFDWLCRTSWDASLLILLARVAQLAFQKVWTPRGCHLLNLLVLGRLLLPLAPASSISLFNLLPGESSALFRGLTERSDGGIFRRADAPQPPDLHMVRPPAETDLARAVDHMEESANPLRVDPTPLQTQSIPSRGSPWSVKTALLFAELIWLTVAGAMLIRALLQHWRFARWVRSQEPIEDERVLDELREARRLMRIAQPIRLLATNSGTSPALFGWLRPCFLIPKSTLNHLELSELRLVFLHELAHVRQRDILLNWAMITARALHWFNPIVWRALHRLRVDRELVCDAMALSVVAKKEHRRYGHVLLKLIEHFSAVPHGPSFVPVVNHQPEIQRRITMILRFKTLGPASVALLTVIALTLALLTFTRAADPAPAPGAGQRLGRAQEETPAAHSRARATLEPGSEQRPATLDQLKRALSQLDARIRAQKEVVDHYRAEAAGLDSTPSFTQDTIRDLEHERISSEARAAQSQLIYDSLKGLKSKDSLELAEVVPTAVPDQELVRLLADLHQSEQAIAKIQDEFGPNHPQVKALENSARVVRKQIGNRVDGIMQGLDAQVQAQKATAQSLSEQAIRVKAQDAALTEKYRPYLEAKRNLELLGKIRDSLVVQIVMKQVGHQDRLDIPGLPEPTNATSPR